MAFAATKEVLESWDIVMSDDQEQRFRESHFEPTWKKYSQMGATNSLSNQYVTPFIKDIASLTKSEKDVLNGNSSNNDEKPLEIKTDEINDDEQFIDIDEEDNSWF